MPIREINDEANPAFDDETKKAPDEGFYSRSSLIIRIGRDEPVRDWPIALA